jgi:transposase
MSKRKRRSFTKEYKAEVVRLIRKSSKSIAAVARDLDLGETAVRRWVEQAEIDSGGGPPGALTTVEREELAQLRKRVKTLEMEREILKKATAFVCHESER